MKNKFSPILQSFLPIVWLIGKPIGVAVFQMLWIWIFYAGLIDLDTLRGILRNTYCFIVSLSPASVHT